MRWTPSPSEWEDIVTVLAATLLVWGAILAGLVLWAVIYQAPT
jgi:hypothetical protein